MNASPQLSIIKTSKFHSNINKDDYSFDATGQALTIQPGALAYVANRQYEFQVSTTYLGNVYYQNVIFSIENVNYVPILSLGFVKIMYFLNKIF